MVVCGRLHLRVATLNVQLHRFESCRQRIGLGGSTAARRIFSASETEAARSRAPRALWKQRSTVVAMSSTGQSPADLSRQQVRARMQAIFEKGAQDNKWDRCWQENVTPWDLGGVTPVIQHLIDQGELPNGRALVPGCGAGYDVLALANDSRFVVGLDISETSTSAAAKTADESTKGQWVQFVATNFFTYAPDTPFNLIFDYTFFCALDPDSRPAWAAKTAELLAPDGELITLIFPIDQHEGGPPFSVNAKAYQAVLDPHGFEMTYCEDNDLAIGPRKGQEQLARWTRKGSASRI